MKKLFTFILALLLALSFVIGCTPSEDPMTDYDLDVTYFEEDENDDEYQIEFPPTDIPDEPLEDEEDIIIEGRPFNVSQGEHGFYAVRFLEHMNDYLPSRVPFTTREEEAARWIADELLAMGFYDDQIQMQTFSYDVETTTWWGDALWGIRWFDEQGYYDNLEWTGYSQNVVLTLPGRSSETIVIGAHYDSLAYAGASDNAAGVALLMETAYRIQYYDHYHTLQFIFFGAEEVGLIGAFYFADSLSEAEMNNLVLAINADVIIEGPVFVYALGSVAYLPPSPETLLWVGSNLPTIYSCSLTTMIDDIADALIDDDIHLTAIPEAIFSPTDHLAFMEFGIPVLYIYGTYEPVYPEFFVRNILHTPNDNLDFIMTEAPGRIEDALNSFGRFLEEILLLEEMEI